VVCSARARLSAVSMTPSSRLIVISFVISSSLFALFPLKFQRRPCMPTRSLRTKRLGLHGRWCCDDGLDHLVELTFDLGLEGGFDLVDIAEFREGPATVGAEVVHAGDPVGVHRGLLVLGILAPVALDLDNEVQRVVVAMAIIHQDDEVGQVAAHLGTVPVRHLEAQVVVFDVL
jgi:hypothetical protein